MLSPSAQGKTLQLKAAVVLKQLILPSPALKSSFLYCFHFVIPLLSSLKCCGMCFFNQLCYQNKAAH